MVCFRLMIVTQLRQWVEANPGRVNDRDRDGNTLLYVAAHHKADLSLALWLLDEKGADMNATTLSGWTALHDAASLGILTALLNRGTDPAILTKDDYSPLMWHTYRGNLDIVARLLQDPRVRATVNASSRYEGIALHYACQCGIEISRLRIFHLLLQAGANPTIADNRGLAPLAYLQQRHPYYLTTMALLEQALADAEKTSLLVKGRCLVMAATNSVAPSYLQGRVARGQPLPCVAQASVTGKNRKRRKKRREFHSMLAFLLGIGGGPKDEGMPRDVFRAILDLLMPKWDPLRREVAGMWGRRCRAKEAV